MTQQPDFSQFQPPAIVNFYTGSIYHLHRIDQMALHDDAYREIEQICNEPHIYNRLFHAGKRGVRYSYLDAVNFVRWALAGWARQQYFTFLVNDPVGAIAAAIDIKGNDLVSAEIGYWCSAPHTGIMSNTVNALLHAMQQAGYREAYAVVDDDNDKSIGVLSRCHFREAGRFRKRTRRLIKFVRPLIDVEAASI